MHVNTSVNLSSTLIGDSTKEEGGEKNLKKGLAALNLQNSHGCTCFRAPLITSQQAAAPHKLPHFQMHEIVIVNLERVFYYYYFFFLAQLGRGRFWWKNATRDVADSRD